MKKISIFIPILLLVFVQSIAQTSSNNNETISQKIGNYVANQIIAQMISDGIIKSSLEVTKTKKEGSVEITIPKEPLSGFTSVPLENEGFIIGDLNGDKQNDIIVPVFSEFGASGSKTEYYVFIYDQNKYNYIRKIISNEFANLIKESENETGDFQIEKIENESIVGTSNIWTVEDAHCCPSLHYKAKFSLINGLELIEKTKTQE